MSIDWFTFAAQIVNFLILVGLLTKFLYRPVLRAMNERKARIEERLAEAAEREEEAAQRSEEYEQRLRELDEQHDQKMEQAREEAEEERHRLVGEAKNEVEEKRQEWLTAFEQERESLYDSLRHSTGEMAIQVARRALSELAHQPLEESLCEAFLSRIRNLSDDERTAVRDRLQASENGIEVRSSFGVADEYRQSMRETFREEFGAERDLEFTRSDDLVCGLELVAGDYRLGWNVSDFVAEVEETFFERLEVK